MKCLRQGGALSATGIMIIVFSLTFAPRRADAQSLPSGWTSQDIGTATDGTASSDGSTIKVTGGGANIWGTADAFHFASRPISGDFTITARVAAFAPLNEWAKAGVMVRESTAATARNAFMLLAPGIGHAFQQRTSAGGTTTRVQGSTSARTWVRITRRGTTFTGFASSDGQSWATIGSATMSLPSTVLVGLGVTSRDAWRTEDATFADVTVAQSSTDGSSSTTWINRDIGSPILAGSWSLSGGTHTVRGAGVDIWDSSDQFHFVYRTMTGDVDVIARVASLQNTDGWAKAGVMIRGSLAAGSRHTAIFATPGNGWSVQYRPVADGTSFATQGPSGQAPGWVRLLRRGDTVRAYTSPDGATWSLEFSETIALGTTVYVGLAVTSHNSDAVTTASFTNVSVAVPSSGGNQAPSVSFASPSNGASFTAPASILVQANATDADGSIARVDLYQGTTLLKSDTTSPYSFSWQSVPAGSYQLRAVAYDNAGATQTAAIDIRVTSGSNQLPTVAITSPANNATFSTGTTVTVQASASDADGSIARVDFYAGTTLLGSDTTSPYTASWTNVAAGSYSLTAVARDNAGGARTSAAVSITVGSSTTRPTSVSFDASTNHDTSVTSYVVALYRSIDPVTASPVATRNLGKPTPVSGVITSDISTTVNTLATGSYYAVVTAVGSAGSAASTPSATFTK